MRYQGTRNEAAQKGLILGTIQSIAAPNESLEGIQSL